MPIGCIKWNWLQGSVCLAADRPAQTMQDFVPQAYAAPDGPAQTFALVDSNWGPPPDSALSCEGGVITARPRARGKQII